MHQIIARWMDSIQDHSRVVMSGKTTSDVCLSAINSATSGNDINATVVSVWSVDPRQETLIRIASHPISSKSPIPGVIDISKSWTGVTYRRRRTQVYRSLQGLCDGISFGNSQLVGEFGLKSLISMPIHNIGNPHQVILVLNLFFSESLPDDLFESGREPSEFILKKEIESDIRRFLPLLASDIESNMRERSYRMATATSFAMGRIDRLTGDEAAKTFANTVLRSLDADYVTVFLENWDRKSLSQRGSAFSSDKTFAPNWNIADEKMPSRVIDTWAQNREWIAPTPMDTEHESLLGILPNRDVESVLLVPLQDIKGVCRGVLRCVNFRKSEGACWRRYHTYDDVAIVEAMGRAFSSLLDRLLESDQRNTSLQTLAHELRVPVVALRAVHRRMEREYEANGEFRFVYPYFKEVGVYTEIMQRLMRQIELIRVGPHDVDLVKRPTNLWTEVAIPANRFIEPILRERGMNTMQIQLSGFERAPKVDVDQAMITQVLFNLLDNAIKYYPKSRPPQDFHCRVICSSTARMLSIDIQDNGSGLHERDESELFQFGYRSSEALSTDIRGSGIGLWLSRGIVERHGGNLVLTQRAKPTIFTIRLPIGSSRNS